MSDDDSTTSSSVALLDLYLSRELGEKHPRQNDTNYKSIRRSSQRKVSPKTGSRINCQSDNDCDSSGNRLLSIVDVPYDLNATSEKVMTKGRRVGARSAKKQSTQGKTLRSYLTGCDGSDSDSDDDDDAIIGGGAAATDDHDVSDTDSLDDLPRRKSVNTLACDGNKVSL